MVLSWLIWLGAATIACLSAWLLFRGKARRGWRLLVGVLAALVVLYPLENMLVRAFIDWIYATPASFADRLLASRHVLPLQHYLAEGGDALAAAVLFAAVLAFVSMLGWEAKQPAEANAIAAFLHHPVTRGTFGVLVVAVLAFVGYNLWLDVQFHKPHPVFYTDCHKIWAHKNNSLEHAMRSFEEGSPGLEMDVRYDVAGRYYYIGRYDVPVPPPGQRLTLDKMFDTVGNGVYFWLDTKTIHYLTPKQAQQAAKDMYALLKRHGLLSHAIVESDTPSNLVYFAREGIHTSYWIFNMDESAFPRTPWGFWLTMARIKRNFIRGGFSAISMDHRFYTPAVAWMLRGARIHLFTINNAENLKTLVKRKEVKVILTNSTHFKDITACH